MIDYKKSVKLSFWIITAAIVILFVTAIALPWIITWYVELRGKDAGLPAVIMLTCYPCFPFAIVALFSLRRLLKNILNDLIFGDNNITQLKKVCFCCLCGSLITFIAGFFYLPFFFVCIAAAGCALVIKVIKDGLGAELDSRREELYEIVEDELEEQ